MQANIVRVFNERNSDRRRAALGELYAEDATLYDPETIATGREAISGAVDNLLLSLWATTAPRDSSGGRARPMALWPSRVRTSPILRTGASSCFTFSLIQWRGDLDNIVTRSICAGAILHAAEKATWMAGEAIQALGGNGYINEYPTGRLWRDAKLHAIGAGTSEIRRMLIGRELFAGTA
jgi:alkylation response protein AidB-like acyl-CoA dehydrogenase